MKKISQRQARANLKELKQLRAVEDQRRNNWRRDYPGGVHLHTMSEPDAKLYTTTKTARQLKHAVVLTAADGAIHCYALPLSQSN